MLFKWFMNFYKYIIADFSLTEEELREELQQTPEQYLKIWAETEGLKLVKDSKSQYIDVIVEKYKKQGILND